MDLHHVHDFVSDIEATIQWWSRHLGAAELPAGLKTASLSKPPRQFSPSIDFDLLPEFFNRIGVKQTPVDR
jgi:hypothetical protein